MRATRVDEKISERPCAEHGDQEQEWEQVTQVRLLGKHPYEEDRGKRQAEPL